MSIIDLMIMSIIFIFFIIIVYYFNKKEYRKYSDINTIFFIGTGILFFISIALSFLSIRAEFLVYTYVLTTSAALLINYSLNKYFLDKSNKFWALLYLIFLFSILVFLQYDNWSMYVVLTSKLLVVLYFLDISYFVTKSIKINSLHKMFFSSTFTLWAIYEFLAIFFTNELLYLLGLIFPVAIAYEFMNIQLELINEEIKKYGQRFESIFDNASDAFFVLNRSNLKIMNLNKSAEEIFNLEMDHISEIDLEELLFPEIGRAHV